MLRHARQAVPWPLTLTCAFLTVVLMGAVRTDPFRLWPLQGVAVGLVAAASGWCLDEPAAAVVDPGPRRLAWRTGARTLGTGVVVGAWAGAVWWSRDMLFGEAPAVLLQGVVAAALATTWTTWRRSRGEATPGNRWAMVVLPVVTAWAIVRPWDAYLPVFPYAGGGEYGSWTWSVLLWATAGAVAAAGLALVLDESHRFRARRSTPGWPSTTARPPRHAPSDTTPSTTPHH